MLLFPPTSWWKAALKDQSPVKLSVSPLLPKGQSCNRYSIITANGTQHLSVPLKGGRKQRVPVNDLEIDYKHDWQRQHWGAIYSAYGRAPFFEHYGRQVESLIYAGYERLSELNSASVIWAGRALYPTFAIDESFVINKSEWSTEPESKLSYHQVFEERWGFTPGLSVIDILMNEGPYAAELLNERA